MLGDGTAIALAFWPLGIAMGGMIVVGVTVGLRERRRTRRLREKHRQTHPNLSAEDFVAQIEVLGEVAEVALGVRQGVARAMGVPPESLYPSDSLEYICQFGFDNMDLVEIVFDIEKALHVRIPASFLEPLFRGKRALKDVNVRDLARTLAENWHWLRDARRG